MKRLFNGVVLVFTLLLMSCSNDDNEGSNIGIDPGISAFELHYTSKDGCVIDFEDYCFDAPIITNIYYNGKGVITFATKLTEIYDLDSADITSITIPSSVKEFDGNPFSDCENLTRFNCKYATSDGFALIKDNTFIALARKWPKDSYAIANGIKTIGQGAFRNSDIKHISIPNSVTTIGGGAFAECAYLEELTLPKDLQILAPAICYGCTNLRRVILPNNITQMQEVSLGYECFYNCRRLEEFIGKNASSDGRCLIVNNMLVAFAPANTVICKIPNGVTTITERCLDGCFDLQEIDIPSSVKKLEVRAICIKDLWGDRTSDLKRVYCRATIPPSIVGKGIGLSKTFVVESDYTIYVPSSSLQAYLNDPEWKELKDRLEGYNF